MKEVVKVWKMISILEVFNFYEMLYHIEKRDICYRSWLKVSKTLWFGKLKRKVILK